MQTITATDLPRFMACNGSRLMGGFTPPVGDDTVRKEGNAADWVIRQIHSGQATEKELIKQKAPNGVYVTAEMIDHLSEYLKLINKNSMIEVVTSFTGRHEIYQINGRADYIHYCQGTKHLNISDFKYGWSIVEPEINWTMISHALGYILNNSLVVDSITFTIYQPRPNHYLGSVRTWTINGERLIELYDELNTALSNPSDALNTSTECYKCPAWTNCPAANKAEMNGIDVSEMAFDAEIDNIGLSFKLDNMKRAIEFLTQAQKAYIEIATDRVRSGQIVENYSLTNSLANTTWKEFVTPEMIKIITGKDVTKKALITPNQSKNEGVCKEVVKAFTERRNKGAKLERIDVNKKAKKMFSTK